ncbi:PREDICTED: uncharacterized protein LOC109357743 isoform X2 [Lupinus angustifolius]|uniref:uncharacterized protein LOC109357743 isoform X2 n=1 Tax=Lupinus angustifolius TaxID=3871 RepID=UPI00092F53B3|nr:PREDICTED: uncharacterized protein LOC109357743 isoform X2 [Lupinus angustifolius]
MDIDGWEILSHDGFLDFNEDDANENEIFLEKKNSVSKSVFDNYFCTSPRSSNHHQRVVPNKHVHVPIQLEPRTSKAPDEFLVEENTKDHVFSKIKENEFVEMKMDSPKCSRVLFPSLDVDGLRFEDKGEAMEIMTSPRMKVEKEDDGFNLWKWSLTGIGAICSFGVAAATICVWFYGSQNKNKLQKHHNIQFQIFTDDKRIKQVVQHATKLNEAISAAARDVPLSRAHITYDGYYDGI